MTEKMPETSSVIKNVHNSSIEQKSEVNAARGATYNRYRGVLRVTESERAVIIYIFRVGKMADRFKELFKEHYTRLQQQGLDLSTATAEALKAAHRDLLTPVPVALVAASPPPQPSPPPRHLARELTVAYVRELLDECRSNSSFTSLIRAVGSFFSDVDALLASFDGGSGTEGSMEVVPSDLDAGAAIVSAPAVSSSSDMNVVDTVVPSRECISIDIESVQHVYQLLLSCGSEGVVNALLHALDSLGSQLQMLSSVHVHSSPKSQMKLYLVVLEQPELLDPKYSHFLCSLLLSLEKTPVAGKMMLVNWIKERAGLNRFRRQIAMFQQFLTMQVLQGQINQATRAAAKILGFYYAARDVYPEILDGEFYNDALNGEYLRDENCSRQEFQLWIRDLKGSRRRGGSYVDEGWNNTTDGNLERLLASVEVSTSFVSFPYVLSPASKAKILEIDAMTQMNQRYQEERREASQRGETTFVPFFVLCVRRAHLMQDSLVTLVHGIGRDEDLKRPLKVMFDAEEGVDAGGVRKEYFQLILNKQHFLNPSYGMFVEHPESHLLWFNAHSFENQENFELIGTLLGIAIYNSVLVDLPMPAVSLQFQTLPANLLAHTYTLTCLPFTPKRHFTRNSKAALAT